MTGNDCSITGKYGDAHIVKANVSHAEYLQHNLRETDMRECRIANCTPWRALMHPLKIKTAETYTAIVDDKPAMMFGVVPIYEYSAGRIWMLCSDAVDERPKTFLKYSFEMVDYFQNKFYLMENIVPIEHEKTIKWLNYLGFYIYKKPFILNQHQVFRFVRCQDEEYMNIVQR